MTLPKPMSQPTLTTLIWRWDLKRERRYTSRSRRLHLSRSWWILTVVEGMYLYCLFSCQSTMWGSYLMGTDSQSFRLPRMYWFGYSAEYGEWRWNRCHDWTIRRMICEYAVYFEFYSLIWILSLLRAFYD